MNDDMLDICLICLASLLLCVYLFVENMNILNLAYVIVVIIVLCYRHLKATSFTSILAN